jgi:putative colanic acid biosynthesis glycosyltransferase
MKAPPIDPPKISVVTINLNMRDGLKGTIESVIAQDYPNLEYLVIDGGSQDGSTDLIREYADGIDYWVSEPDRGLYDAMNKGARAATGEWVIYMNAGDRFHDEKAVSDVFRDPHLDADLVYGHALISYEREQVKRLVLAQSPSVLPLRMNCSHQSLFTRCGIVLGSPFSLGLMAADYEFLVRMHVEGKRFKMVDRIIGVNANRGMSDRRRLRSLSQRCRIAVRYRLMTPRRALCYAGMAVKAVLGLWIKRVLPRPLTGWILRHKSPN